MAFEKLPDTQELYGAGRALAMTRNDERTFQKYFVGFNNAATRDYFGLWPEWFAENRGRFSYKRDPVAWMTTLKDLTPSIGTTTFGFFKALDAVRKADSEARKPVMTAYFAAQIEALGSLNAYRGYYEEHLAPTLPKLMTGYIASKQINQERPHLYDPLLNAYEHVFDLVWKMLGQFQREQERMPDVAEFDTLSRQLSHMMFREAVLSRRDNALSELHAGATDKLFSFEMKGAQWRLKANPPTFAEKRKALKAMPPAEIANQKMRRVGVHHGCPVAFGPKGKTSAVRFVVDDVMRVTRESFWGDDIPAPAMPLEAAFRELRLVPSPRSPA
jgi:hypothetical protein